MERAQVAFPLELLTIGQIFDRAITLVVRHRTICAALGLIYIFVMVGIQIIQWPTLQTVYALGLPGQPHPHPAVPSEIYSQLGNSIWLALLNMFLQVPIMVILARILFCAYFDRSYDIRRVSLLSLRQLPKILWSYIVGWIGFSFPMILIAMIIFILAMVIVGILGIAWGAMVKALPPGALTIGVSALISVIIFVGTLLVAAGVFAWPVATTSLMAISISLEASSAPHVVGESYRRITYAGSQKRQLFYGLLLLVIIALGVGFATGFFTILLAMKLTIVAFGLMDLANGLLLVMIAALGVVYYLDFRLRYENYTTEQALADSEVYAVTA